jgi:hypothetical protein
MAVWRTAESILNLPQLVIDAERGHRVGTGGDEKDLKTTHDI